jgi:malonate transporter
LTVLPIFALVFAGWAVRRLKLLGPQATIELNRFVVYLSLPALLFSIVVHAKKADVWQPGFVLAFGLSCLAVFALTVSISLWRRGSLADAAIDGLNSAYPNTGFMGFPLVLALFGERALPFALIASIITVCVLFGLAITLIEVAKQADRNPWRLGLTVAASLLKNPLILSPLIALFVATCFGSIPKPADVFLKLLSSAASPCALVALGLFLAEEHQATSTTIDASLWLAAAKLVLQPVIAWGLCASLHLPAATTSAALLLAALPTGTGPFMLAEAYRCEAAVTARTILITTFVSIFTIAAYLHLIGHYNSNYAAAR